MKRWPLQQDERKGPAPAGLFLAGSCYDNHGRQTSTFKHFTGELDNDPATYNDEVWETQSTTYNLNSDPTGHKTTYRYQGKEWDDLLGKAINVGYTNDQRQDFIDYDAGGFVSAKRGNHGQNVRYTYNANGDLASVIDSLNHTTSYAYDRQRRVNHVTDAANGHTSLTYDPVGRLVQVKDPRNLITTYTYDGFGQLWSQASPDTGTTTFAYNAYGQRTGMTRADGGTLAYTYDTLGRLKTTGNATRTRTYGYDTCTSGKGRLCTFGTTGGGATDSTALTYTAQGQIATRTDKVNGATDITGYNYDGSGRLAGISYPGGVSVGYGYAQGLLTQITATVNGTTSTIAGLSGYQVFGPPTYLSYGNGVWRQTNYDNDGRLTGISSNIPGGPIQSLTYGFDADDRITSITDGVEATLTQNMGYDALSRMTSAAVPGGNAATFAYDAVGNRIGRTDSSPTPATTYTYSGTSNRLLQSVQGSLTRTYSVNAVGDTYAFTGPDGVANQLTYDPFDRLASHVRSGVTTTYAVNAQDQRVAKTNPTTSSRYIYAGQNQLLAEYTNGQWTSYVWNGNDPVALVRANQIYYIHPDHLGRPEKVTNSGKAIVWKANNFGFNRGVALDSIGGLNLGFPGQYWDAESGLWHNGYRDYDYSSGRYLQSDPIGLLGGSNSYAYALNNPESYIDENGLCVDYLGAALGLADIPAGLATMGGGVALAIIGSALGSEEAGAVGVGVTFVGMSDIHDGVQAVQTAFDGKERPRAFEKAGALFGPGGEKVGGVIADYSSLSSGLRGLRNVLKRTASDKDTMDAMKGLGVFADPCHCKR